MPALQVRPHAEGCKRGSSSERFTVYTSAWTMYSDRPGQVKRRGGKLVFRVLEFPRNTSVPSVELYPGNCSEGVCGRG